MMKTSIGICFVPWRVAPQFASGFTLPDPPEPEPVVGGGTMPVVELIVPLEVPMPPPAPGPPGPEFPVWLPPVVNVEPVSFAPQPHTRDQAKPAARSESAEVRTNL